MVDSVKIPVGKFVQDIIKRANIALLLSKFKPKAGDIIKIDFNLENKECTVLVNDQKMKIDKNTLNAITNVNVGMISTLKKVNLKNNSSISIIINVGEEDLLITNLLEIH